MEVLRVNRAAAAEAHGIVIVIDVIRAFTVAAYAFAGGARGLWLVRTVDEALALREREADALLAGEIGGRLIAGFDLNNSPARMAQADVRGRRIIQRTGAGTQGAVGATGARHLLVGALVNARATAAHARALAAETGASVTLMPTNMAAFEGANAVEDDLCADYLEALLRERPDAAEVLARAITALRGSGRLGDFETGHPDLPPEDVPAFLAADRFGFAMVGVREQWQGVEYIDVSCMDVPCRDS